MKKQITKNKTKQKKKSENKKSKELNKNMTFSEIINEDRDAAITLANKGMFCCGCPMAMMETLEQGAQAHGIDADDLIKELNKKSKKKK